MQDNNFSFIKAKKFNQLNINLEEYKHDFTAARHFHLATNNSENVFMVSFRTLPEDSTGIAHILEHLVLCGSEKYPFRDPFFSMIKRSVNSFMNAFTSSDWTAYPFASNNKTDFNNLLNIYLDAVFFPKLNLLDFKQEGHRLDIIKNPKSGDEELVYKGVVFNEMKGAMSSTDYQLYQKITSNIFHNTTYHNNSGGDPRDIPELTHENLVNFHKLHYHPSNSIFFTFGDISAAEHQENFNKYLERFSYSEAAAAIHVKPDVRLNKPSTLSCPYSSNDAKDILSLSWLLPQGESLQENQLLLLEAQFLEQVLLATSSSPLMQYLETSKLGVAPGPIIGLEDEILDKLFTFSLEGAIAADSLKFEQEIISELNKVATNGVKREDLEATLFQFETSYRDINSTSYPYGLGLIMRIINGSLQGFDPFEIMDYDKKLDFLKAKITKPNFIKDLINKFFLANNNKLNLSLVADAKLGEELVKAEKAKLSKIKDSLEQKDLERIKDENASLLARQQQDEDLTSLPKIDKKDLTKGAKLVSLSKSKIIGDDFFAECATNDLNYFRIYSQLSYDTDVFALSLLDKFITDLGVKKSYIDGEEKDYLETAKINYQNLGSLSASIATPYNIQTKQDSLYFSLGYKTLADKNATACDILLHTFTQVRFDETKRIQNLISQLHANTQNSITDSGHILAMDLAASKLSKKASFNSDMSGVGFITKLEQLNKSLNINDLVVKWQEILTKAKKGHKKSLLITNENSSEKTISQLQNKLSQFEASEFEETIIDETQKDSNEIKTVYSTATEINFCGMAIKVIDKSHVDSYLLSLIALSLRNGFLHNAIREAGGAYGGGASYDSNAGIFRFFSYRDPRDLDTIVDFKQSIKWLLQSGEFNQEILDEAILNLISSIDKPLLPVVNVTSSFGAFLNGVTDEYLAQQRLKILSANVALCVEAAYKYLNDKPTSIGIITNEKQASKLYKHGFS